ncbi:hypothetical protein ES703_45219 [subsurface metagenome]
MLKALVVTLICLLTLYAPVELTRVIVAWGLDAELLAELSIFWALYLLAILILIKVVRVKR